MTASSEDLAKYLDSAFSGWRRHEDSPFPWVAVSEYLNPWEQRPSAKDLGNWLIADGEFQALRLGNWLGTPQGELIAAGLQQVSPPFLREDEALLKEGLNLAVQMQAAGKQQEAGRVALGVLAAAVISAGLWLASK